MKTYVVQLESHDNLAAASRLAATGRAVTKVTERSGRGANRCGSLSREASLFPAKESTGFGDNVRFLEVVI